VALIAFVAAANALGNFALSVGMNQVGRTVTLSPLPYLAALLNPWVLAGVCLLIGWLLAQLSLLSRADLSFVLPVTAASYVLAALLGATLRNEAVTRGRWAGILLIAAGVWLVGRTRPRTA
jgi:uncharacterized membrane protein